MDAGLLAGQLESDRAIYAMGVRQGEGGQSESMGRLDKLLGGRAPGQKGEPAAYVQVCLLYTSDAADE